MLSKRNLNLVILAVLGLSALCGSAWAIDGNEPIAHWNFDEGEGTTAYDSAGENDGSLIGDSSWVTGKVGSHAIELDGDGDYVDCGNDPSLEPGYGSLTIAAWVKAPDENQKTAILSKRQPVHPYEQYGLGIGAEDPFGWDGGRKFQFAYIETRPGSLYRGAVTENEYVDGDWHHVVVTADKVQEETIFYVDGTGVSTLVEGGSWPTVNNDDPLYIGYNGIEQHYFEGKIDDVRIYDTALSDEEIRGLYYAGFTSSELAIMLLEDAIAEKVEMLEVIDETLQKELTAYNALEELLASGDYGDLNKHDIATAQQKIRSAIQRQERSRRSLEESIGRLEDALMALGWEPPADEPIAE